MNIGIRSINLRVPLWPMGKQMHGHVHIRVCECAGWMSVSHTRAHKCTPACTSNSCFIMCYPCLHVHANTRSGRISWIKCCFDNSLCGFDCSVRSFIAESWLCASSRAAQLCHILAVGGTWQDQGLAIPSSWASVPDFSESLGRCAKPSEIHGKNGTSGTCHLNLAGDHGQK